MLFQTVSSAAAVDDALHASPILANLSLEELSQIKIVSVSQRAEPLKNAAAAVRVVTSEDIARSGATSIPEALRTVPGLNVAQINGSTWAIGARGFQSQYANKLLVMMDGVSVYSPIYSGVFWDQQNYFLPDLDQIEVVLGPGGSIWGANAMNGVINIITKSARDTQGGLIYGGGGTTKAALAGARYGWQAGTNTYVRVYGTYDYDLSLPKPGGGEANDATRTGQGGFRADGYPRANTQWTLKGDIHWGENNDTTQLPDLLSPNYIVTNNSAAQVLGGQMLGRWQTELTPDSTLQLQAYYDFSQREESIVDFDVHTADVQMHHTWTGWRRQVVDWGLDGRMVDFHTRPRWAAFDPAQEVVWLGSGFVQDEIELVRDRLFLTGGIKLEGHSVGGFLPQPNARLTWHPAEGHTLWAAWSQALRSPSEVEQQAQIDLRVFPPGTFDPNLPAVLRWRGNQDVNPEELQSWELGWRWQAAKSLTVDVASYYYQYKNLIMATYGTPYGQGTPAPSVVIPVVTANGTEGDSYGGEMALTWRPCDAWFATVSYSVRHTQLHSYLPDPIEFAGDSLTSPRQTVALTSGVKLGREVELTGALRYLDNIPYYHVPAYVDLDLQLAWRPTRNLEVALVGQNLLHDQHAEYHASLVNQTAEIPRGVYAKVTWRF